MKKLTLKDWKKFTSSNCENSYSLIVQLIILTLWEEDSISKGEEDYIINKFIKTISEDQAVIAIEFARMFKPEWIKTK